MRVPSSAAFVFGLFAAAAPVALAGDPKPAPKPPPVMASDADAVKAVAEFKEAYKAKGLKGDERISQREFAMRTLAKLQHPLVVEALAPVARESEPMLRMLGTIYLGDQTLLPGLAGKNVVTAWKRGLSDDAFVMTAMQSVARLRYLGARDDIRGALKSQNFAVKKVAIGTIVMTGDLRLVRDMLSLVGVQLPAAQGSGAAGEGGGVDRGTAGSAGGSEVVSEGYSWEGAEAVVDYGMADNTQENAEAQAQVEAQIAANQAAAAAAAGSGASNPSGGGNSGGSTSGAPAGGGIGEGGGTGPGKGGGRSNAELIPLVLGALQKLTGQTFTGPAQFKKWWADNAPAIAERMKKLDDKEKFQKEEAAAQSK
jgi:hypothetical protein